MKSNEKVRSSLFGVLRKKWIPACAGMTIRRAYDAPRKMFRISVGIAHPTERKPMDEQKIGSISQTAFLSPESTSVWSFPVRGAWATHNNKYRGNFAPQIARNVIERYSQPGELVLDPMAGGGTTLIEAKLLGRGFIGCDINPGAVKICEKAVEFDCDIEKEPKNPRTAVFEFKDFFKLFLESIPFDS